MSAKRNTQDCCVVTIGHSQPLMPAADGLKVMALLRNAAEVEIDFDRTDYRSEKYIVGERPRCELTMVSQKDLRAKVEHPAPVPAPRKPRLLGHD